MTRSRQRRPAGRHAWRLLAAGLCAWPAAAGAQPVSVATPGSGSATPGPAAEATGTAGQGAQAAAAPSHPSATEPLAAVSPAAPGPAPTAAPTAAPASAPRPADPTEGDRTALINQDVAQHPPQTEIASRDPSHLQTARMKLGGLLDRSVRSLENSEVGRVIDVMTGDDGRPAALELDVGGFLGVGNRRILVAWHLFDLSRTGQNDPLRVTLSAAQVRSAPAMDDNGDAPVVTGATPASAAPTTADKPLAGASSPAPGTPAPGKPTPGTPAPGTPAPATPPPAATVPTGFGPAMPPASLPAPPPASTPAPPVAKATDGKPAERPADGKAIPSRIAPTPPHRADHDVAAPPRSGNGEDRF